MSKVVSTSSALSKFVPIDHVRDLQIRMKFEHSKPHDCRMKRAPGCFHSSYYFKDESQLRDAVDSLQAFRTRVVRPSHDMNIEFVLMTDLDTPQDDQDAKTIAEAYFTNFLQSIRNTVYELLHERGRVSVRVTHQDDGLMAFPKNYTGLYKMTKDQWEYVSPLCDSYMWYRTRVLTRNRRNRNNLPMRTGTITVGSSPSRVVV